MNLSVILLSMLILLYSNCNLVCDLWEEQKQASEPESDLQDTVDWRIGLLISMLVKLNLFHSIVLITVVLLVVQWMDLFLKKNHLLRCLGCFSLLNQTGALTFSQLLRLSRENWSLNSFASVSSMKFVSCEFALYLCQSSIRSCRNTDVMSGLVFPAPTWICWISNRSGYVGMLVLLLLPLVNPLLIV